MHVSSKFLGQPILIGESHAGIRTVDDPFCPGSLVRLNFGTSAMLGVLWSKRSGNMAVTLVVLGYSV